MSRRDEEMAELRASIERIGLLVAHLCARVTNIETVLRLRKMSSLQTTREPLSFPLNFSGGAYDTTVERMMSEMLGCPAAAPAQATTTTPEK